MNQDVNDTNVNDPVVSSAYRESATETAPDALNQSVLREARQRAASGSLYARSIFWLRPMAWAATIGLCLAIVIDLNDVPRPEPGLMSLPAPARDESDLMQRARKSVDEEGRVTLSNVPQLEKVEAPTPETVVSPEPAPAADDGPVDSLSFEMSDQDIVGEAEELARRHEGKNIAVGASGFLAASAPALESAMEMPCDAAARETPQTWLVCIEGLETDGLDELAAWQRDELQAAFPEFELP